MLGAGVGAFQQQLSGPAISVWGLHASLMYFKPEKQATQEVSSVPTQQRRCMHRPLTPLVLYFPSRFFVLFVTGLARGPAP